MNSPERPDLEQRFKELEREVNQTSSTSGNKSTEVESSLPRHDEFSLEQTFERLQTWFQGLPTIAKVAVAVVAAMIGFSLLNTVLKVVTSLLSLAIMGVVLYLLYKFFLAPRSSE
ncbi:MAG: hypothetical protein WA865_22370 [Spirulinaceae cyanobacterium]